MKQVIVETYQAYWEHVPNGAFLQAIYIFMGVLLVVAAVWAACAFLKAIYLFLEWAVTEVCHVIDKGYMRSSGSIPEVVFVIAFNLFIGTPVLIALRTAKSAFFTIREIWCIELPAYLQMWQRERDRRDWEADEEEQY